MRLSSTTFLLLTLLLTGAGFAQTKPAPDLERWIADLGHFELARQEAATRALIAAGDPAARKVEALCSSPDRAIALRARRVFGAIRGVSPEVEARIQRLLRSADDKLVETADALSKLGAPGLDRALSLLATKPFAKLEALRPEIIVRRNLRAIADGLDREDRAHSEVLSLGARALAPLKRLLEDRRQDSGLRVQALWLHGLLESRSRAATLAPMLSDPDPLLRRELARTIARTFSAEDFPIVAKHLPTIRDESWSLFAEAAADRMESKRLHAELLHRKPDRARLAALACGQLRDEKARDVLIKASTRWSRHSDVRIAVATGLGRFRDPKAIAALVNLYTKDDDRRVRAAAVTALGNRAQLASARLGLISALVDPDEAVRSLATETLVSLSDEGLAPALAAAAEDGSLAVRNRALAALELLLPEGPRRAAKSSAGTQGLLRQWHQWLKSEKLGLRKKKGLPWYEASNDATRIFDAVRSQIRSDFFYFDKEELVEEKNLDAAALKSMRELLTEEKGLLAEGAEREVLASVLQRSDSPRRLLALLGCMPFENAKLSDLIRLTNAAAGGMVNSLGDRFSRLVVSNDAEGRVKPSWVPGLLDDGGKSNGFSASKKDGEWVIDFVLFDSPAWYAEFRVGDRLVKIGESFTKSMEDRAVRKALAKKGSFHILREGWNRPYAFELVPAEPIEDRLVTSALLPDGIGYLRLKMFELGCSGKIEAALGKMEKEGVKGLVLDLRNNPGGTVIDAITIVDKFLPKGKTITINLTRSGEDEVVKSSDERSDRSYPLVVLVNSSSASASEMTSGSLQGNERAVVIGTTSYGKGIGQNSRSIPGFVSRSALGESRSTYVLSLTMMRYFVPKDRRSIHLIGVEPDQVVKQSSLKGSALDKVMRVARHPAVVSYVDALLEKQRTKALELAVDDGGSSEAWEGFDELYVKVKRNATKSRLRRILRAELRRRLLPKAETEEFSRLLCDLAEDRVLQAAVAEIMSKAEIQSESPRYRRVRRK